MRFIKNLNPWVAVMAVFLPVVALAILPLPWVAGVIAIPVGLTPFFIWMWSVVEALSDRLPSDWKGHTSRFRFAVAYTSVYLYVFSFVAIMFMYGGDFLFALIIPFHLLGMVTSIYAYSYVSRVSAQAKCLGSSAAWSNFIMLCMFPPLGVWVIQRQLRSILQGEAIFVVSLEERDNAVTGASRIER